MHVYCNFYCSPAKKYGSDPPLFFATVCGEKSGKSYRKKLQRGCNNPPWVGGGLMFISYKNKEKTVLHAVTVLY